MYCTGRDKSGGQGRRRGWAGGSRMEDVWLCVGIINDKMERERGGFFLAREFGWVSEEGGEKEWG